MVACRGRARRSCDAAGPIRTGCGRGRALWHDPVLREVEAAYTMPVDECLDRPVGDVSAGGSRVPAMAPALPHRGAARLMHPVVERALHLESHIEPVEALVLERTQRAEHVADLAFENVDDRVAAAVGVGPVEHEEIREARDADPEV